MKKCLTLVFLFFCVSLMLCANVHAYIDPGVTTQIVQLAAAAVVAVSAVVTVLWRRAKKKVQKTLHIDENAKKEVEEDVQFDEDEE